MASPIFLSHPPPGFTPMSVIRGIQLAILGAYRTLQNPALTHAKYYHLALTAVKISIFAQFCIWVPVILLRAFLYLCSYVVNVDYTIVEQLRYLQNHIMNIGPLTIGLVRVFKPELHDLFLLSLEFVDAVYARKHPGTTRLYYSNFVTLKTISLDGRQDKYFRKLSPYFGVKSASFVSFLSRYGQKTCFNIALFILSKIPKIGTFVIACVSFQSFNGVVGTPAAVAVFTIFLVVPKFYSLAFLTTFWGARSIVSELLVPYFDKIPFNHSEKQQWFRAREGVLFGFGVCFYYLMKIPFIGVLVYGFAEASVAYLITKITDPPPSGHGQLINWASSQTVWNQKDNLLTHGFDKDEGFAPIPGSYLVYS